MTVPVMQFWLKNGHKEEAWLNYLAMHEKTDSHPVEIRRILVRSHISSNKKKNLLVNEVKNTPDPISDGNDSTSKVNQMVSITQQICLKLYVVLDNTSLPPWTTNLLTTTFMWNSWHRYDGVGG
jgi:hypothetical protein